MCAVSSVVFTHRAHSVQRALARQLKTQEKYGELTALANQLGEKKSPLTEMTHSPTLRSNKQRTFATMFESPRMLVDTAKTEPGSVCYQAPSNIALVKYWGKHGVQLPRNPNASFTLSVARTITELAWAPKDHDNASRIQLELYYDGELREAFAERVRTFFGKLTKIYPFLEQFAWTVKTHNTFPHGAGIASSASAMAALAACLVSLEEQWFEKLSTETYFQKASYIARLGSGSAARSVFAKAAAWGTSTSLAGSSDEYAVSIVDQLHPSFQDYRDSILLVSSAEKSVSSSAGHGLMDNQPYAPVRYDMANRRFTRLLEILKRGELDDFCTLVEADALDLHALMMQSTPPYILMEPNTIAVVNAVRRFRESSGLPVCFTLDAGPNVHLLYPKAIDLQVNDWLKSEIAPLLPQGLIYDHVGEGASRARLPEFKITA